MLSSFSSSDIQELIDHNRKLTEHVKPKLEMAYYPDTPLLKNLIDKVTDEINQYSKIRKVTNLPFSDCKQFYNHVEDGNIFVGIEFDEEYKTLKSFPKTFRFSLKFPSEMRTEVYDPKEINWKTDELYKKTVQSTPRGYNSSVGGPQASYISEGFATLQFMLGTAYIREVLAERTGNASTTNYQDMSMQITRFPDPPFVIDNYIDKTALQILPLIPMAFLSLFVRAVFLMCEEKERKLREIMIISGITKTVQWLAWFIWTYAIYIMNTLVTLVLLKMGSGSVPGLFHFVDWDVMCVLLLLYQLNMTMSLFLIAALCNRSVTAVYSAMTFYLASIIALIIANMYYWEIPFGVNLALSMMGNIGIGYAFRIAIYQDLKMEKLDLSNVMKPPFQDQQYSIGWSMIMMFVGILIQAFIFFIIDYVIKGNFCEKIPLTPAYNRKSSRHTAIDADGIRSKVYLSVKGMKKIIKKRTVLDNVTFNVYVNEVTAVIGNNESGKYTLLDIIAGFIRPTEGGLLFDHKDPTTDPFARRILGYCPMMNTVFGNMSVEQHIQFFGIMRGLGKKYVRLEVKKFSRILKVDKETKAKHLTQAQRRKLSIINALCGRTKVVVIDEPSYNTDPMTKREIWEIIHREKEGRAILISTNYMDEADMLGDRIAIMFEGKLVCYGTTFFLKKKYGNGYYLVRNIFFSRIFVKKHYIFLYY